MWRENGTRDEAGMLDSCVVVQMKEHTHRLSGRWKRLRPRVPPARAQFLCGRCDAVGGTHRSATNTAARQRRLACNQKPSQPRA
jgi:hypothetical protein